MSAATETSGSVAGLRVRLRYVGRLKGGAAFPDGEQGVLGQEFPFYKVKHLEEADATGCMLSSEHSLSAEAAQRLGAFIFPAGSVVFAKVGAALTLNRFRHLGQPSCIDNNMMGLVVDDGQVAVRYLLYALSLIDLGVIANPGAVPSVNAGQVGDQSIPLPPLSVQRAIADYLDRETARLDALVAAKERVLGLLAEKRRALITRAVTRGLDPHAPLRNSGIPWLGKIPAHWELKRLKHVGRAIIGLTFDPANEVTDGSGVLVLRASNVRDQRIVLDDNVYVSMEIPSELRTREGDILICARSGSRALIGKNAVIDGATAGLTFGAFMTVFRGPHNAFLFYVFNSPLFDYQAGAFSTSTINQLTVETLNGMEVPLPPRPEQEAIVKRLREGLSQLDSVSVAIAQTIALLSERRSTLIAAAVTGQIEVPGGEEAGV